MQTEVLPSLVAGVDLGDEMLEVGPGPGAATDWLRQRVGLLAALELDPEAASRLSERFHRTNVEVIVGDASAMTFASATFDSVGSFTMLHHVPTVSLQDKVIGEMFRVLRPGGVLIGSDSLASNDLHHFHVGDTYNPIEPSSLFTRLQTIGFHRITVIVDDIVKFVAYKPSPLGPAKSIEGGVSTS
jgi:ubiquinone/menaquinone biosynthesis C-methylase UbiE